MPTAKQLQGLDITVINTELAKCDDSWNYRDVNSPFSRLYLILEGSGQVIHSGRKFDLSAGNMLLVPAFAAGSYKCPQYLLQYYIHFTHNNPAGCGIFDGLDIEYLIEAQHSDYYLFKRLLDINPGIGLIERDPAKYHKNFQMKRSFEMADRMRPADYLESTGIILQLIARFLGTAAEKNPHSTMPSHYNFRKVLTYISTNFQQQITISHLSKMFFVSDDHFSRVFLQTMGIRPLEYINRKRIEKAQMMLLSGQSGLEQIALRCGFSSASHLSRHFKKHLNMTPGQYRKKFF